MNDWIVAGLNNPDFTVDDFESAGLTPSNTSILPEDAYKKSPFILKAFDKNGNFDEEAFDAYYKKRLGEFGYFSQEDKYEYDLFDTDRKPTSRVRNPQFALYLIANPDRVTFGVGERNGYGEREKSRMELAQTQQIYDPETNTFSEETVNDSAFVNSIKKWIKSIVDEPLVIALYDEDGVHYDLFTGQEVKHKKGDYKLNSNGTYYTEKLNGRNPNGKQIVRMFDTITVDGEGINKYDFFDCDDIDKSIHGVIWKNFLAIAPLFTPISPYYSSALVAREIAKAMPMLYSVVNSYFGDGLDSKVINQIAAYGEKFSGGVSEYGLDHMLSFENLANMISDVVTQWGTLRVIATGVRKLLPLAKAVEKATAKAYGMYKMQELSLSLKVASGEIAESVAKLMLGNPEKWMESSIGKAAIKTFVPKAKKAAMKANRIAGDASLMYMSLVSNTDVYNDMLEHGATKKEAATFALASTIGMFGVDRWTHLGEIFLHGLGDDVDRSIRATFRKSSAELRDKILKDVAEIPQGTNKLKTLFRKGLDFGKNTTIQYLDDLKYHSLSFLGKALGEGLEEVGEELVTDLVKSAYEALGDLNLVSLKKIGAWDNAAARYGMSFLGGFLGGGIFAGVDLMENPNIHRDTSQDDIIYLVQNGYKDRFLKALQKEHKSGNLGSTSLGVNYETDDNGRRVYLTKKTGEMSLNDFVYKTIVDATNLLDNILNENQINLSDELLFMQMVLSDSRFTLLKDYLDTNSLTYLVGYAEKFKLLTKDIINTETALLRASKTIDGIDPGVLTPENTITDELFRKITKEDGEKRERNLDNYRNRKLELLKERDKFLSGEYSMPYAEKMLFAIDSNLNQSFISMNYDLWLYENKKKTLDLLTEAEAETFKAEYLTYKHSELKKDLDRLYNTFKEILKLIESALLDLLENEQLFDSSKLRELLTEKGPLNVKLYHFNDVLDFIGETEESLSYLERLLEENVEQRINLINETNQQLLEQARVKVLELIDAQGGYIDPGLRRQILLVLQNRNKDIINNWLNGSEFRNVLSNLNLEDFSNEDEIKQLLELAVLNKYLNIALAQKSVYDVLLDEAGIFRPDEDATGLIDAAIDRLQDAFLEKTGQTISEEQAKNLIFTIQIQSEQHPGIVNPGKFTKDSIKLDDNGNYYITENPLLDNLDFEFEDTAEYNEFDNILKNNVRALYEAGQEVIIEGIDNPREYLKSIPEIQQEIESAQLLMYELKDISLNHPIIRLNNDLKARVKDINPVKNLVKSLAIKLGKNSTQLESVLDKLADQFESLDRISEFSLTDDELAILDEAVDLIEKVKAYLYAATIKSGDVLGNGSVITVGHNKALNDFAAKHKDAYLNFNPLPTISANTYSILTNELNNYLSEIGIYIPEKLEYSAGSWKSLHFRNIADKKEQFIRAEKAFKAALLEFFKTSRDSLKIKVDGQEYDLLEGYESTGGDVEKILHLLYTNYLNLKSKGITLDKILDLNDLLQKVVNIEEIPKLLTGKLDLDLSGFTDYTKLILLGTFLSNDINEWNKFVKLQIESDTEIAPIFILELVSRIACAYTDDKTVFGALFNKVKQLDTTCKLPTINAAFINGVGGAGKSRVCARNVVNWLKKDSTVWLCAPQATQVQTLQESVGKGIGMTLEGEDSLYSKLFDVSKVKEMEKHADELKADSPYYTLENQSDGNPVFKVNTDKLGIKKVTDAPTVLIIDESTFIHNTTLQAISSFCDLNNVKLVLLGHDKQNGVLYNLRRELCMMVRTPELSVSLRDNNVQHQYNLRRLENLISELSDLSVEESKRQLNRIKSSIKMLNLKVYNNEEVNGDLITNTLNGVKFDNITPNEKGERIIGYVGNNSSTVKELQSKGLTVVQLSEKQVLGLEFDLVVIERNWNLSEDASVSETFLFLTDLYTMLSRGKFGTIFLSSNLQNIIGNNTIEYVKALAPSIKNAIKSFIEKRKLELENVSTPEKTITESPRVESKVVDIAKSDRLTINTDVKEGLYSYNWIDKYDNNPIGFEIIKDGDIVKINIGYIKDDTLQLLPKDSDLWNILEVNGEKPNSLLYNTKTKKLSVVVNDTEKDLKANPYPDMLTIDVFKAPEENGTFIMYEEPIEGATFSEPIDEGDISDSEENTPTFKGEALCYGANALTGYKVKEKDGKEVWERPSNTDGILRDLQCLTDQKTVSSTETLIRLSNLLRSFRNNWLYKRDYGNIGLIFRNSVISKEEYENAKFFVEIRKLNDTDNFIRNLGLDNKKLPIGDYVYTVVVEFKNLNGDTCRVTLGALSNPETQKAVLRRLGRQIEQYKEEGKSPERIAKLEEKRLKFEANTAKYVKLMEDLYKSGERDVQILTPDFTGMTHLRKFTSSGNPVQPMRLYSYTKALIKSIEEQIALSKSSSFREVASRQVEQLKQNIDKSFLALNPYAVVSDVYIYAPDKLGEIKGIDKSVIGSAVVFVSNDDSLAPENLIDEYIVLKNAVATGGESNARVRMLVLNNVGVQFRELISPWHKNLMQISDNFRDSSEDRNIKGITPFKNDFMGARMYVSLWNFRANLLVFCNKLSTFVGDNSLDIDTLEKYAIVKDLIYKRDVLKSELSNEELLLVRAELDDDFNRYSESIDTFNELLNGSLKLFRLGGGYNNGFYIRQIVKDKSLSDLYGDIVPNGIFITPSKAFRFKDIIESVFTNMLDPILQCEGIDKTLLLTTKEGAINSLSKHYKELLAKRKITITEGKSTVTFEPKIEGGISSAFEDIPAILMKTVKYVGFLQAYEDYEDVSIPTIKVTHNKNDLTLDYANIYDDLFKDLDEDENDLYNLMSLCFHGTVEDINDEKVIKCSDAMFPKGLFVDPMCSSEVVLSNNGVAFKKCIINPIFFTVDVMVDDPTFYITFDPIEKKKGEGEKPNPDNLNNNFENPYLDLCDSMGITGIAPDATKEDIEEIIDELLESNLQNVFTVTDIITKGKPVSRDGNQPITFELYFANAFKEANNEDFGKITQPAIFDNNAIIITSDKYSVKVTGIAMDGSFIYEKIQAEPDRIVEEAAKLLEELKDQLDSDKVDEAKLELSKLKIKTRNKAATQAFTNKINAIKTKLDEGNLLDANKMLLEILEKANEELSQSVKHILEILNDC